MARPLRIEFPGAVYHVTSRGNDGADVFLDADDRQGFLDIVAFAVERFGWRCHAYCLMGNHYHLLIETPQANLSRGMRQLNGVYTQRFNRRHGRTGHVFQGRFKAILVDRDRYLLELSRHVVLNPVRTRVTRRPDTYAWSSYRATAGLVPVPAFLSTEWVLSQFGQDRSRARRRYAAFVAAGTGLPSVWANLRSQVLLGDDTFVASLSSRLTELPRASARRQRSAGRPTLGALLPARRGVTRDQRNAAIHAAHVIHGYTLAQIAAHVGLHFTTISRIAARAARELPAPIGSPKRRSAAAAGSRRG